MQWVGQWNKVQPEHSFWLSFHPAEPKCFPACLGCRDLQRIGASRSRSANALWIPRHLYFPLTEDLVASCNSGPGQAQKETSAFFYLPPLHYALDEGSAFSLS